MKKKYHFFFLCILFFNGVNFTIVFTFIIEAIISFFSSALLIFCGRLLHL